MTMALKTEWIVCGDDININEEIAKLERYCVGKVRIIKGDFEPGSPFKMTTKLEFEVILETNMDEFWDLVDGVIDDESEA